MVSAHARLGQWLQYNWYKGFNLFKITYEHISNRCIEKETRI